MTVSLRTGIMIVMACLSMVVSTFAQEIGGGPKVDGTTAAVADTTEGRVWEGVRITSADGWNWSDVSLSWLTGGSYIRITLGDGRHRDFPPSDVVAVRGADGTDLMAEIAAARPVGDGSPAHDDGPAAHPGSLSDFGLGSRPKAPPPFDFALTVGGSYGYFEGIWFTGFESSPGLQAAARLRTGSSTWITLSYIRQGGGSPLVELYDESSNLIEGTLDLRIDEFLFMVGLPTRPFAALGHIPYAEIGAGVLHHSASTKISGVRLDESTVTKGAIMARVGSLIPLGRGIALDVGIGITHKPGLVVDDFGGTIFGAHLGLGPITR